MPRTTRALVVAAFVLLVGAPVAPAFEFVLEVREPTGENLFARNVYFCPACTPLQHVNVTPPVGFEHAGARFFLPASSRVELPAPPPGVAPALDLVPEIPGAEYVYVAKLQSAQILGFSAFGPLVLAQVQRDPRFLYEPGQVVHELVDPAGQRYVLFSTDVALSLILGIDASQPGALDGLPLPAGWSYASRVLESDLLVVSNGLATVFVQGVVTSFQRIEVVDVALAVEPKRKQPKPIKLRKSSIKAAIFGEEDFDVTTIDVSTLAFGPAGAPAHPRKSSLKDLDRDGLLDLISRYATDETGIQPSDTEACVTGETLEGVPFEGCDAIQVKTKKPKKPKKP